jgi:hypothetical protein
VKPARIEEYEQKQTEGDKKEEKAKGTIINQTEREGKVIKTERQKQRGKG